MIKLILTFVAATLMLVIQLYVSWPTFSINIPNFLPCEWFTLDLPEWTLYVNNVSCNRGPTSKRFEDIPKDFFKDKIIKRIHHYNGTIENRGCTKYTEQCSEHPSWNEKIKKRINTPPCCRENVIETLRHITTELQLLNVTHFLTYGNLIGWWRNGKMIPNDHDYDLLMDSKFYHSSKFDKFLKLMRDKYNHHTVIAETFRQHGINVKMKVWIFQSKINRNGGDIWPYEIVNRRGKKIVLVRKYNWASKDQPYDNVFPLKRVTYHDFPIYVPNKVEDYLGLQYGKNGYQKELTCQKYVDMNCLN